MQLINRVIRILKGFSSAEMNVLRNYLNAFTGDKNEEHLKAKKLLELIVDSGFAPSEKELKKEICNDSNIRSFERTLLNLKNKIWESLILDINVDRKNSYGEASKARIKIKKQFAQAFILLGKGQYDEVNEMYVSMAQSAEEFELYDDLVEILRFQKTTYSLTYNSEEFNSIKKQIDKFEHLRIVSWKAKDYYYQLVLNVEYKADNGKNFILLVEAISDLENELLSIDSDTVRFYLMYLKTHYFQESGLHEKAHLELGSLIALLNKSKVVYTPFKLANAIMNLGENLLYQNKFKECLLACRDAEDLVKNNLYNYAILKEIEFNANFYSGNFDAASRIIDQLLLDKQLTSDDFRRSKRYYMKACVCFMKGDFPEVKNLLEMTSEIKADKEGWNIGIRVLEILNQIEISSIDNSLTGKIEKFRKFSDRQNKISPLSQRDLLIKNLLVESEKLNYDFELLYKKRKNNIEKLADKKNIHGWKFPSAEFVIFHEWLECKRAGTKYNYPLTSHVSEAVPLKDLEPVKIPLKKVKVLAR